MRINSIGNVGIGDLIPDRKLHVNAGVSNVVAKFESTDSIAAIEFADSGGSAEIGNNGNDLVFFPAGAERMRIDSSGSVGIGTDSPSEDLHVSGTGDTNIAVESTNTGAGANAGIKILAADGGDFLWQTGNATGNALRLYDLNAVAERMRIDSSGAVLVGTPTAGSAGAGDIVVSGGVYLGGTGAANLLDDYESGTWTPSYLGGSFTYTIRSGSYTKIGNTVHATCYVNTDSVSGTGTDTVQLSGLPFTNNARRAAVVGADSWVTAPLYAQSEANTITVLLGKSKSGSGNQSYVTIADMSASSGGYNQLYLQFTYQTNL
jgi:hypothetical protein